MNELISIIIPVKNGHKYLGEAIAGIRKQNMNVEILVVDDASTDDTALIAESLGCKVLRHEVRWKFQQLSYWRGDRNSEL